MSETGGKILHLCSAWIHDLINPPPPPPPLPFLFHESTQQQQPTFQNRLRLMEKILSSIVITRRDIRGALLPVFEVQWMKARVDTNFLRLSRAVIWKPFYIPPAKSKPPFLFPPLSCSHISSLKNISSSSKLLCSWATTARRLLSSSHPPPPSPTPHTLSTSKEQAAPSCEPFSLTQHSSWYSFISIKYKPCWTASSHHPPFSNPPPLPHPPSNPLDVLFSALKCFLSGVPESTSARMLDHSSGAMEQNHTDNNDRISRVLIYMVKFSSCWTW